MDTRFTAFLQTLSLPIRVAGVALTALLLAPPAAQAQGVGVQAGVSADPDQFVMGVHYESGFIADRVSFRPGVDIGLGNDITTLALNFDLLYTFATPRSAWSPFVGGGPAINVYNVDRGRGNDDSDVEPGLNFLAGVKHDEGFFAEVRFGAINSPDFKFVAGWRFR
ncbi:MAG: hypothetical protein KJ061_01200 [Vicinamibacteraceae bacterium]|nr:hypothetical protein [Vicinamibacteraceae bacterium]